ncbi:MAG TPA: hypothetical protein VGJ05_01860 [Fimbriiglobus sp.]|jgi:hypothetical protein
MTRSLSRFEYNLVRLLHFFLGQLPAEQAQPLLIERRVPPPCLSADCVHLVKDSLAKGCALFLVRAGGWRNDRYLHRGTPVPGRVWQRIPLEDRLLSFSRVVLDFLIWITAEKPSESTKPWTASTTAQTCGDELFFLLVFEAIRSNPTVFPALSDSSIFADNPLCRLAYPADFVSHVKLATPRFEECFSPPRAAILECLQPWLAARWLRVEREAGRETDWARLARRGRAVTAVSDAYLTEAEKHDRRDLARFVLRASSAILTVPEIGADFWSGSLQGEGPPRLQERIDARRAAMAVPGLFETLENWTRSARSVGYFDEGYAASQMWKEDWEAAKGDEAAETAKRVLAEVEPLRT